MNTEKMTWDVWKNMPETERVKRRDYSLLIPQLRGLEGKRVEVIDKNGDTRRFYVGRSTGWTPVHLEIKTKRSTGGMQVYGAPFQSVRIVK